MMLRCDLCRIEVPDERVLADHTNGKRHQALLSARQRFETSQNASIYITRIKPQHDQIILKDYFARFGPIKNCFIDKEKHVYAIIEYEHPDAANQCLQYGEDYKLSDGTCLKVKERNHHEFKSKRMLISEEEFLNVNKEKEIEQHAQIVQTLNNQSTIDEQAQAIVVQEKMNDETLKAREEFYKELQDMFSKYFPEAKVSLIGSMATGLATNLSDLDLVLLLNDTYLEPQQCASRNNSGESMHIDENSCSNDTEINQNKFKRNVSDESSTRSMSPPLSTTACSADELLQMSVVDRLDYIRRLLRSSAPHVCHVQRIAQARCPVIRFCHKQQKIFCELSINNHLAVANTDLIRYFLTMEPKLRPLLQTVRLWAKQKDLLGRGHRFNTYTLFWMIVCALQMQNQHLPSVRSLAERAKHQRQHGPWNCSVPDINHFNEQIANMTIEQMLDQFFVFYSKLNANEHQLSPWSSKLETKSSTNTVFSIIDPFEHDHILTSNMSSSNWTKFQEECSLAHQILHEFSKKRQNKSWGLSLILTRKTLPQKDLIHQTHNYNPSSHTIDLLINQINEQEDLTKKIDLILKEILLFEQINYEMIRKKRPVSPSMMDSDDEVTPNSLAEQLDETLSAKRRRTDDDGYTLTPVKDETAYPKEKIYFQVNHRTWQDRRRWKRSIEEQHQNQSQFEREKFISEKLKEDGNHRLSTPIYLSMEMKLLPTMEKKKKLQMRLELQTNEQQQLFVDLNHFLHQFLPKMLED